MSALTMTPLRTRFSAGALVSNVMAKPTAFETKHTAYLRSRKMQPVYYLTAVLGISLIGALSVVALEVLRPEGVNTQAAYTILGFLAPTLVSLLAILRSVGNAQALNHLHDCTHQQNEHIEAATKAATVAAQAATQVKHKVAEALTESGKLKAKAISDSIHDMHVETMHVEKVEKSKE